MVGCVVMVRRENGGVMVLLIRGEWWEFEVVVRKENDGICGGCQKR